MIKTIQLIIFFILGSLMGSFYTVLGNRLPNNEKVLFSTSHCDSCNHKLNFLDMIPILSFVFLRGKCRYCHKPIDSTSTFMELISGVFFATAFYVFGTGYEFFIAIGIVSMLMIITVSDINYFIIPDELLIFMSIYFIVFDILNLGLHDTIRAIGGGLFLFALMYLIMLIGNYAFKKESLGGGDIKMMFIFGLILGPLLGTISIFIGSFIALPISIYNAYRKNEVMLPFGPYLAIGSIIIFLCNINFDMVLEFISK